MLPATVCDAGLCSHFTVAWVGWKDGFRRKVFAGKELRESVDFATFVCSKKKSFKYL